MQCHHTRAAAQQPLAIATAGAIAVLGFLTGRPDFLDLALIYALLSFIGTIAILKYVAFGDLASTREDTPEEDWPW